MNFFSEKPKKKKQKEFPDIKVSFKNLILLSIVFFLLDVRQMKVLEN